MFFYQIPSVGRDLSDLSFVWPTMDGWMLGWTDSLCKTSLCIKHVFFRSCIVVIITNSCLIKGGGAVSPPAGSWQP